MEKKKNDQVVQRRGYSIVPIFIHRYQHTDLSPISGRVSETILQKLDSFSSLVPEKVFLKVKHISSEISRSVSGTLQQFASFRSSEKQLIFLSLTGPISKCTAAYSLLRVFSLRCSKSLKKFSETEFL